VGGEAGWKGRIFCKGEGDGPSITVGKGVSPSGRGGKRDPEYREKNGVGNLLKKRKVTIGRDGDQVVGIALMEGKKKEKGGHLRGPQNGGFYQKPRRIRS